MKLSSLVPAVIAGFLVAACGSAMALAPVSPPPSSSSTPPASVAPYGTTPSPSSTPAASDPSISATFGSVSTLAVNSNAVFALFVRSGIQQSAAAANMMLARVDRHCLDPQTAAIRATWNQSAGAIVGDMSGAYLGDRTGVRQLVPDPRCG